jgi:hypothetical protein
VTDRWRNVAASVRQRLKNLADRQRRPFQEVLQYFAIERFLYRLGVSRHRDSYVLKGALMLAAWRAPAIRPTLDIDLLGRGKHAVESFAAIVRELCDLETPHPDGIEFDADSVVTTDITVDSEYVGKRATFRAKLGTARVPMQIDLGVGDAVIEPQSDVEFPTLLGFPGPRLHGYSRESTVAEKLHAMVVRGRLNSRMKDYYDILLLSRHFDFDGAYLALAIRDTFARRVTALADDVVGWSSDFAEEAGKQVQWRAFLRRIHVDGDSDLGLVVARIRAFLQPVLVALLRGESPPARWTSGAGWAG